jgi:hypothetical protein
MFNLIMILSSSHTSPWTGFELKTLVVIDTGSCKSNTLGISSLLVSSYLGRSKKYKIDWICVFSAKCTDLAIPVICQTFHENGTTVHISAMCYWVNVVLLAL